MLLIMPDDVGFGATTPFGGPVPIPAFERIAKSGLRYTQIPYDSTLFADASIALISGRNHHTCATGVIMEIGTGLPGYNSLMPKSCGTVAQVLKGNGFNTAWYGKNHNVPDWHSSQAGPFDLWPTGLGFEQFFGFIGGDTSQFTPAIFDGTRPDRAAGHGRLSPRRRYGRPRNSRTFANKNALAPRKAVLRVLRTRERHTRRITLQTNGLTRFKGQFDQGWDKVREQTFARQKEMGIIPANAKLTPRPESLRAWDSLNREGKRALRADDGSLCRRPLAHGSSDRSNSRRDRGDLTRWTTHW